MMAITLSSDDDYQKALFAKLLSQGMDTSPVQSWTQGAARMAQALVGGMGLKREKREREEKLSKLGELMFGGPPPLGGTAPTADLPGPSKNTMPDKVYSGNEPTPLDVPAGEERDRMVRLLSAEAGNQSPEGQQAVASVIRNRAASGQYGGDTATGVMTKPWAFEPMMTSQGQSKMAALDPNSPQYARLGGAIDRAYAGDDPTKGATHFYSPAAQAQLGRQPPSWAQGQGQQIGDHRFYSPDRGPTEMSAQSRQAQPAPQAAAPQSASNIPPQAAQQMRQLWQAGPQGRAMAAQMWQQYQKPAQPTDDEREYMRSQRDPAFLKYLQDVKRPPQTTVQIDQRGESAFKTEAGKGLAKQYVEMVEGGRNARQSMSDVQTLGALYANIGTGKLAEAKKLIGPYAGALGIDIKGLSDIQAADAIAARLAPSLRTPGSGAQSDYELRQFIQSVGSIGNTPEGNALINKTLGGMYENRVRAAEIASKALAGEIPQERAEALIRALPDPMQEWRETYKKANSGGDGGWRDLGNGVRIREKR